MSDEPFYSPTCKSSPVRLGTPGERLCEFRKDVDRRARGSGEGRDAVNSKAATDFPVRRSKQRQRERGWQSGKRSQRSQTQTSRTSCAPWALQTSSVSKTTAESYRDCRRAHSFERMERTARPTRYSPEVRERAVRLVREHGPEHPSQWAAIAAIAPKLGCTSETLRRWVRQAERDTGHRAGLTTDERQRMKELEREVRELKRANEILRKASAYFAQAELDRRAK